MISLLCVDGKNGAIDHISQDLEKIDDFSVTTSCSGEEALMLLKKRPFDVILSAGEISGMKGIDLLHAARENGCNAPFIFFDGTKDGNRASERHGEDEPVAHISDITGDARRSDPEPNTSEKIFRAIANRTSVGVLIHRNGNLIYANHAAEEITGYSREEMQAIDRTDLLPPADRDEGRAGAGKRLEGALPAERYTIRILQKNRSERAIEITADLCAIGESRARILSGPDTLTLKKAEDVYSSIFISFIDLYFRTDMDGTLEMLSPSCREILGWTPDEARGRNAAEFFADPAGAEEAGRVLLASGCLHDHEVGLLRKDETEAVFSLNAHLIRDADGSACGIEGALRDITDRKQMEEELCRSKALFAATLEATKDGILATDRDGRPIACNGIFRTMWGVPDTCPVPDNGRAILDIIAAHLKDPDETYRLIADTCKQPDSTQHGVIVCTDGRTIEYFTRPQTIGGAASGRVWSFSDITEREKAERDLRERESFFTTLLEAIRDGVLILREDGTVQYANRAACELVGLPSADDCVERSILEFVHQDSAHAVFMDILSVRGGLDAIPAEYTFVTPAGRVRQVEGLSSTITWKEKKAIAVTLRDITERKQAEAAAQENADLNRALIDGLPEYIIVLTREGEIIFANPAAKAASGCARGAMNRKTLRSSIVESSLQDFDTAIQDARTGQKRRSFEIGIRTATDECLLVTLRAAPITFRDQDATLVLMTDLTERLILEKELEYHAEELKKYSESLARTNEKLTIMNSITRHDILNQLTVLLGYLEIAIEENEEPETRENLERMKFSAQNIREQLEFARDYQDIGVREPQWFDVRWHIAKLKQDGITITTRIQKMEVYADPLFGRVFYNLLDNAVRHGKRVTDIEVTVREEEDGALTIIWDDNGVGVKEGEKEKIFRRGYGNNTGLGLFLCREILAITGMTIRECGEYGKGARFEIGVPPGGYRDAVDRKSARSLRE